MKLFAIVALIFSSAFLQAQEKEVKSNRLAKEASPYLRQHAKNPVDWYPWGKEAFAKAKKENKPILLSIGYSTCHWCHVMERESFEDPKIAAYLNKHFVAIKLDREERPDIDKIYMTKYNLMSGESGGWPLNVFLTPDLEMFYGGTYFPPRNKGRSIGFESVIEQLHNAWSKNNEEVMLSAKKLTAHMKKIMQQRQPAKELVDPIVLKKATDLMMKNADLKNGGWGKQQKFPMPSHLNYLLRSWKRTGDKDVLDFLTLTANKMAYGGIRDHLGGGFHRYTVDSVWLVPHFEKMLYDQAQLLDFYTELWLVTKDDLYKQVAKEIAVYVIREMQSESGGYYSAQDAQSEGKEGKYYCWTMEELKQILDTKKKHNVSELDLAVSYFGITEKGNFYDHSDPKALKNQNVLFYKGTVFPREAGPRVHAAITKMRAAREKRIKPMIDKKILASWNGMMIGAMYRAGLVFDQPEFKASASKAFAFIKTELWDEQTNRLSHRFYNLDNTVEVDSTALAESYLQMMRAARRMYELSLDPKALEWAIQLAEASVELFYDKEKGGFYESAKLDDVVIRLKGDFDGATPTASSVAVLEYLKLYTITGNKKWQEIAHGTMKFYGLELNRYPSSLTHMLVGVSFFHSKKQRLVIVAANPVTLTQSRNSLRGIWRPNLTVMSNVGPVDPFNLTLKAEGQEPSLYYCEGTTCKPPVNSVKELLKMWGK